MTFRLSLQVVSMEMRKVFAYRSDFWLSFIVSTLAQFVVAWFLWKSIFLYKGMQQLGDFDFNSLMFYYLLVPIIGRTVFGGNMGDIASEIYQGTLNRYLIYPLSFFVFKLLTHCANAAILLAQVLLVILGTVLFFPSLTSGYHLSLVSMLQGCITTLLATILYFIFSSSIQLIAFWADNVWSLSAILRFITGLLGGSLIPLSLFPASLQPVLMILPFASFIHLPMQCFLGKLSAGEWVHGMCVLCGWIGVTAIAYAVLWHRGNRVYTGVGI